MRNGLVSYIESLKPTVQGDPNLNALYEELKPVQTKREHQLKDWALDKLEEP